MQDDGGDLPRILHAVALNTTSASAYGSKGSEEGSRCYSVANANF